MITPSTGPDSKIMITDFGLSAYKRHDEPLNTTCGTPEYIAPGNIHFIFYNAVMIRAVRK